MYRLYKVLHTNGTSLSLRAADFPGCCGGLILLSYFVDRPPLPDGTPWMYKPCQKDLAAAASKQLHQTMMWHIRSHYPNSVFVCMDPVLTEQFGWAGGTAGSRIVKHSCTLQYFCKHNKFRVNSYAKGEAILRSRRLGVFSLGPYKTDGTENFCGKKHKSVTLVSS